MNKVIYLPSHTRRHPLLQFLVDDWMRTRRDFKAAIKLARDYRQFRRQRYTCRAAFFLARNSI